jgi:acetyl esterase/lipase
MKKLLSIALWIVALPTCLAQAQTVAVSVQSNAPVTRLEDVIYGRKAGTALTLDVFQPAKPNGYGIAYIESGAWYSAHEFIRPDMLRPFTDRGYTVFAVVHGSQPKFPIAEIVPDIHRAIRFIRHNAARYGVNPDHLGISGASSGGHLSLTMAVKGVDGKADAKDPVDRASSAVQAVACFFPPTDFLNYGETNRDAVGFGPLQNFKSAFGSRSDTAEGRLELGHEISPIYFVHSNMPSILIIHGSADNLVPVSQSEQFVKRCEESGVTAKLIVREGKGHGWPDMENDLRVCADWFDEYLRGIKPAAEKSP